MRGFLRWVLPPAVPIMLLVGMAIYVLWSETTGEPRIINGEVDDDPFRAAGLLLFASPFLYGFLFVMNLIDSIADRWKQPYPWVFTVGLSLVIGLLTSTWNPNVEFIGGFVGLLVILLPLSILRRSLASFWIWREQRRSRQREMDVPDGV